MAEHQWIPEDSFSYEMEDTLPLLQTRYEGLVEQVRFWHSCCCASWRSPSLKVRVCILLRGERVQSQDRHAVTEDVLAWAACMGGHVQVCGKAQGTAARALCSSKQGFHHKGEGALAQLAFAEKAWFCK